MAKPFTKEDVILHKKQAIRKVNDLLEMYINHPNEKFLKKANLLSYWLENFSDYIRTETSFNPQELISYKRGDVVKLNFGFNVGSEHGGLHYAIVLDNDNMLSSPVVTVVPLSSGTASTTYQRDVYLGQELYIKLNTKNKYLLEIAKKNLEENDRIFSVLQRTIKESNEEPTIEENQNIEAILSDLKERVADIKRTVQILEKYDKEISHMKQGSIAMMEQITTISKMRIYIPKNSTDLLYGISFSPEAMEKINSQLINLYVRDK